MVRHWLQSLVSRWQYIRARQGGGPPHSEARAAFFALNPETYYLKLTRRSPRGRPHPRTRLLELRVDATGG
jgi:hypothetical protein